MTGEERRVDLKAIRRRTVAAREQGVPYEYPRCFAHLLREDGEVGHCLGPLDHWGHHAEDWPE